MSHSDSLSQGSSRRQYSPGRTPSGDISTGEESVSISNAEKERIRFYGTSSKIATKI